MPPHFRRIPGGIHANFMESIWNIFGWEPSHFDVSFHIHSIWKLHEISIFHGTFLWNPGGIHHNLFHRIHRVHSIPYGFHIISYEFHMDSTFFHIFPNGFHMDSIYFHIESQAIIKYSSWGHQANLVFCSVHWVRSHDFPKPVKIFKFMTFKIITHYVYILYIKKKH